MNEKEFLDFFYHLFDNTCSEELNMDTEFRYLDEWSSLTGFYFINDMKDKYGINIDVKEFKSCDTLGDLFLMIENKFADA